MRLIVGAATNVGRVRPSNEDAFLVREDQRLFVVCDGMGGAAAGEVASHLAIESIAAHVDANAQAAANGARGARLRRAIASANQAILLRAAADPSLDGMGTTVVGAWLGDGIASIAHVGDSRAYISARNGFRALTVDHSLVEAQVRAGVINREESRTAENQHVLLRALGRDPGVEIDVTDVAISPGDRLMLCTDGLTRMVSDHLLAHAMSRFHRDPRAACDYLIDQANRAGGIDNITLIIVDVDGGGASAMLSRLKRAIGRR